MQAYLCVYEIHDNIKENIKNLLMEMMINQVFCDYFSFQRFFCSFVIVVVRNLNMLLNDFFLFSVEAEFL